MLETSKDVLYLVISFCIIWVTVFLCWTFYYLVRLLKNANEIVEEFRVRIQSLAESVDYVRHKVESISDLLTLAGSGVGSFVQKVAGRKMDQWAAKGMSSFDDSAKDAVKKAMEATAKKMKTVAKKIR
ncbi:MAG: hypothetical protein Q7S66_00880 [bacterium]|nr:hypothetical protein [bacterium]